MSDGKGISTDVLAGRNRAVVEVVDESAPAQPGGPRPDGFEPINAEGWTSYAQPQQREQVRSATAEQLAQVNPIKTPARRGK
jgi:hypothetical protein